MKWHDLEEIKYYCDDHNDPHNNPHNENNVDQQDRRHYAMETTTVKSHIERNILRKFLSIMIIEGIMNRTSTLGQVILIMIQGKIFHMRKIMPIGILMNIILMMVVTIKIMVAITNI